MLAQAAACKPPPAASLAAGSPPRHAAACLGSARMCSRRARVAVATAATAAPAAGRAAVSTAFEEYILDLQQRIIQARGWRLTLLSGSAHCPGIMLHDCVPSTASACLGRSLRLPSCRSLPIPLPPNCAQSAAIPCPDPCIDQSAEQLDGSGVRFQHDRWSRSPSNPNAGYGITSGAAAVQLLHGCSVGLLTAGVGHVEECLPLGSPCSCLGPPAFPHLRATPLCCSAGGRVGAGKGGRQHLSCGGGALTRACKGQLHATAHEAELYTGSAQQAWPASHCSL